MEFALLAAGSACMHAGFIAYGQWQDSHMSVKYTDIDYWVVSDAAMLLLDGRSPYDRPTYRYSPLLALLLTPNRLFGDVFGKALYSVLDLACSFFIYALLRKQGVSKPRAAMLTALAFALNPLVVTVSTRGNSEPLICALTLAFIWLLSVRRRVLAAAVLGLAVHVKMYPVVLLPSVLVFMGLLPQAGRSTGAGLEPQSAPATPVKAKSAAVKLFDLQWKHVQFVLVCATSFLAATSVTYLLYGAAGIRHSLLHHLSRQDHRHNFSPYWLLFYHNSILNLPQWLVSGLPFVPQAVLSLTIALKYGRRDFCFACFLQIFVFVSLNKYFLWYLSILPVCMPSSLRAGTWGDWAVMGGAWFGGQALFLALAYKLEFQGIQMHEQIWLSGLLFMLTNTWIAGRLVAIHAKSKSIKA